MWDRIRVNEMLLELRFNRGFDFCDFELARKDIMHNIFANVPEANELIEKLC